MRLSKLKSIVTFSDNHRKALKVDVTEDILTQLALGATANDTLRLSRIRPLNVKDAEAIYRFAMTSAKKES